MKTLLVRPGVEIVEKTLRGPWPPELGHLEKLYKEPGLIFRGLISFESISSAPAVAVGSILKGLGEDVEFLDVPFEFGIPLTEALNVKRNEKIEEYIAGGGYDVVGISCTSLLECLATKRIAEAAKRASKHVKVVVGGYQAASDAFGLMEKISAIDVVVLGDFELIAEQLYSSFSGKRSLDTVPNVVYRENSTLRASEKKQVNLEPEDLPVFDYSLVEKYIPNYTLFPVEASRGCPYNCSFCQEKVLRQSYTVKDAVLTADQVIDASNYIAQFVEVAALYFSDALWGLDLKWVKDFCSELIERRDEIAADTFGWGIETRVDQFNYEYLSLMKKAGCFAIGYGVESLSPTMLEMMNKTRDPQKYITSVFNTVEQMLKVDMQAVLLFILGMPGETPSTIAETLHSVKKFPESKNLHFQFGLPVPYAGTLLEKQIHDPHFVKRYGLRILDEFDWKKVYIPRFTLLFDPSKELSASEMTKTFVDITCGIHGISSTVEKQSEGFEEISTILDKDQISPEELAQCGSIYRRIVTKTP